MIQHVGQHHKNGCFVASLAMLLGCSYEEAFKKVFPKSKYTYNYRDWPKSGYKLTPEKALRILDKHGIKTKKAKLKRATSLKKRTALIMLRWKIAPELMHAVVFDGETGKIYDPGSYHDPKVYDYNMHAIYYIEKGKRT